MRENTEYFFCKAVLISKKLLCFVFSRSLNWVLVFSSGTNILVKSRAAMIKLAGVTISFFYITGIETRHFLLKILEKSFLGARFRKFNKPMKFRCYLRSIMRLSLVLLRFQIFLSVPHFVHRFMFLIHAWARNYDMTSKDDNFQTHSRLARAYQVLLILWES